MNEKTYLAPIVPGIRLDSFSQLPDIYEISCSKNHLTLSIWNEGMLIKSVTESIPDFFRHIGMTSGLFRLATDRFKATKMDLEKSELRFLDNTIDSLGEEIWNFIHNTDDSKKLWELFINLVKENSQSAVILVKGPLIATWPIECMVEIKSTELNGLCMIVIKQMAEEKQPTIPWFNWFKTDLPKTVVFMEGPNPPVNPPDPRKLDQLDIESEVKFMYHTLFPMDGEEDFKCFKYFGQREKLNDPTPFTFLYLPNSLTIEDIRKHISTIQEPYIFIYSGHGLHPVCSSLDGQLYYPNKEAETKTDCLKHDKLVEAFVENPPFITLFNCCSTIRSADIGGYPADKFTPMEQIYQSIPSRTPMPFRILFGNRAATLDSSSIQISRNVAMLIVNNGSIFDLVNALIPVESHHNTDMRLKVLTKRDRAVGTLFFI